MRRWSVVAWCAVLAAGAAACSGGGGDPEPARAATVSVVSQNLLHGIACAPDTNRCDLPSRVRLFTRQLADADCPQLVGIQEANAQTAELLAADLPGVCGGRYTIVNDGDDGVDREVVLTTLPVLGSARTRLAGPLRTATWVRVAADVGVVDYVTTHLASSSDDRPCDTATCPPPCTATEMIQVCQARQTAAFAAEHAAPDGVLVVGGDLNAPAGSPTLAVFTDAGLVDSHVAARNTECGTAGAGVSCTSGREDSSLADMSDPASVQTERIDFVLFRDDRDCAPAAPTGLFNEAPADRSIGGLAFPSDHTGVIATLACPTTDAQRRAATAATVPTTTTVPGSAAPGAGPGGVDPTTRAAVGEAYSTVFDGTVTDPERKLAAVEDGPRIRDFFLQSFEQTKDISSRIVVRVDDVTPVDGATVAVTYTLLLDGSPVLDHLPGRAVRVDGTWLVSRRTFCDVATQGASAIPPACAD